MTERKFQRLAVSELGAWLGANPDALILDARDANAFAAGNIETSVRLDGRNHEGLIFSTPKSRPVFIYCYRGNASQTYAQQFADFGFRNVADLVGGWEGLQKALAHRPAVDAGLATWLNNNGFSDVQTAGTHGNTPLMHAAWKGEASVVDALLAAGARVDAVNNDGNTALWLACVSNDPAIVQRIASAGADIDHANLTGATSLMYAASSSKPDIVATLLALGADPLIQTQDDFSALDMAASVECLQLLRAATRTAKQA
ncbi:ankyrin repeat domain-containing protein [Viridibacterium curvum]|uniref:Rhodanese domain-containing protein n=1 Tax=Viridibacterium curvum TaxID=1101404 RepID=A0ABP9R646_9RHOO